MKLQQTHVFRDYTRASCAFLVLFALAGVLCPIAVRPTRLFTLIPCISKVV